MIEQIINPYVVNTRKQPKSPESQKALLILDVFEGQVTHVVKCKVGSLSILMVQAPANMTHLFQPLDLTVNKAAKQFIRKSFITYYLDCISKQLEAGKEVEDIEVNLRLTVIKPLHAQWLVDMYNHFSTAIGKEMVSKGWKRAKVQGVIDGSVSLPPENPYQTIFQS